MRGASSQLPVLAGPVLARMLGLLRHRGLGKGPRQALDQSSFFLKFGNNLRFTPEF